VDAEYSAGIVECLPTYHACNYLVEKKLKLRTPSGDTFDPAIAGKDGPINEKATKSGLARLQSLARLTNDNYGSECVRC
jgi:hypothetical protein